MTFWHSSQKKFFYPKEAKIIYYEKNQHRFFETYLYKFDLFPTISRQKLGKIKQMRYGVLFFFFKF